MSEFGVQRGLGGHSLGLNFDKTVAQKLHRSILLHIGLETFNFQFARIRKVFTFLNSRPSWTCHPQNQLFSTLDTPKYFKKNKKSQTYLPKILIWEISKYEDDLLETACSKICENGIWKFETLETLKS